VIYFLPGFIHLPSITNEVLRQTIAAQEKTVFAILIPMVRKTMPVEANIQKV
jgi:hypothetical protein